jgi:hypothetical protein
MGKEILDKLSTILQNHTVNETEVEDYENDDIIIEKMVDFIETLDPDQLSEDQADIIYDIIDMLAPDEEDEEVSEVFKKRQRRDISARRQRRREYRKKRAKVKLKARKYRRSAQGRKTLRRAKRFKKIGRTSTMKRQRKFIGPK